MGADNRGIWVVAAAAVGLLALIVVDQTRSGGGAEDRFPGVPVTLESTWKDDDTPATKASGTRRGMRNPHLDTGGPTREAM